MCVGGRFCGVEGCGRGCGFVAAGGLAILDDGRKIFEVAVSRPGCVVMIESAATAVYGDPSTTLILGRLSDEMRIVLVQRVDASDDSFVMPIGILVASMNRCFLAAGCQRVHRRGDNVGRVSWRN